MTERLSDLLHDEADRLVVPPAPASAVADRGRRIRRRRRLSTVVAATAVVAVLAGAAVVSTGRDDGTRAVDPAGPTMPVGGAAFSIGPTVYLDDGRIQAEIDDTTVKSLYYTSAGVLVRHGENNYSDGGGPQRFSLVRPDGQVSPVSVETEETVHATDPDQPFLAYAQRIDGEAHVLVRDVDTDQQVADVTVADVDATFLPVSLDGDLVFLGDDDQVVEIDWRTGDSRVNPVLTGSAVVTAGRAVTYDLTNPVVDVETGEPALSVVDPEDTEEGTYYRLSPDGRFVASDVQTERTPGSFEIFDLDDGSRATVEGRLYQYGWTPEGDLFAVGADGVLTTCSADTGACTEQPLDLVSLPGASEDFSDNLQLGGVTYES